MSKTKHKNRTETRFYNADNTLVPKLETRMDGDVEKRYISGYAIVFDKESHLIAGEFREIIKREAVQHIFDGDDDITVDYNHNPDYHLGKRSTGTATLTIDDTGVQYRVEVPNTTYGNDLAVLVERGDITGGSFVFSTARDGADWERIGEGEGSYALRTVNDIAKVWSLGPVTREAYPDTTIAMRSLADWKEREENPNPTPKTDTPKMKRLQRRMAIAGIKK